MVINVRGTHGSGKSTLVGGLVRAYPHDEMLPERLGRRPKPDGYLVTVPWLVRPVYVVGSYRTACGGCDGIQPFSLIFPRVEEYARLGHVLFEGALVSTSGYGRLERCRDLWGAGFVAAFLDTPLDVCLARIAARRAARGVTAPLDPTNTRTKWESVLRSRAKVESLGVRTAVLDHSSPAPRLASLLREGDRG